MLECKFGETKQSNVFWGIGIAGSKDTGVLLSHLLFGQLHLVFRNDGDGFLKR
jgi:hypothetical protein